MWKPPYSKIKPPNILRFKTVGYSRFVMKTCQRYLASKINAAIPDTIGAAAEVPEKLFVQWGNWLVVVTLKFRNKKYEFEKIKKAIHEKI